MGRPLTPRETQIARLVAAGWRNVEIAKELGIVEGTVEIHLRHVYEKLNLDRYQHQRVLLAVQASRFT